MFYYIGFQCDENKIDENIINLKEFFAQLKYIKGILLFKEKLIIYKEELQEYLKYLYDNNRILSYQNLDILDHIISNIDNPERYYTPSKIKNKEFETNYSGYFNKDKIINLLKKSLGFANKIILIDPYFSIHFKKDILNQINNFAGLYLNKSIDIEIHINKKCDLDYYYKNLKEWQNFIQNSKHNITLYVWDDSNAKEKMHDRFLITDSFFISIGKGIEEHNDAYATFSYWSFLDNKEVDKLLVIYKENSTPFILKDKLTKNNTTNQIQKYSLTDITNETSIDIQTILQKIDKISLLPKLSIETKDEKKLSKKQKEKIIRIVQG